MSRARSKLVHRPYSSTCTATEGGYLGGASSPGVKRLREERMHEASLEIEVVPEDGTVTLVLRGELDMATVGTLRSCLDATDGAFRRVTLDLRHLRFMDSSGIGALAEANRRFAREGRELVLRSPRGLVADVVEIAGLSTVMAVEDHAVGA